VEAQVGAVFVKRRFRHKAPLARGAAHRGFTLLEMLVAITLGALVLGLLWSALDQVGRVERVLGEERWRFERNALRMAWFQTTVRGLIPRPKDDPGQIKGDAKSFTGTTTQPLDAATLARATFTWSLRYRLETDATELVYRDAKGADRVVLAWPGNKGRFRYLNAGRLEEQWPPVTLDQVPLLPAAIVLESGVDGLPVVFAAPAADEYFFPRRIELEGI
jgi:prepilin-type N-terminal cleavage/methylation domain-containing protein